MSAAKNKEPAKPRETAKAAPTKAAAKPAGSSDLQKALRGPLRLLLLVSVICAAIGGGGYAIWRAVGPMVLNRDHYRLTVDSLEITPPPPWLHADIRKDVFYQAGLDEILWIHDPDLAERVAKAFEVHPWVHKVERVTKRAPARIEVELVYRRPVCLVEVTGGAFPVDAEGIVLPKDELAPGDSRRFARLTGVNSFPTGLVGMPWGDLSVVGGAEIAAALADDWEKLPLERILVAHSSTPGILYELLPQPVAGLPTARIIWGHAPGSHEKGEVSAAEKIARLKRFLADKSHDSARTSPLQVDLRYGPVEHTAHGAPGTSDAK